MDIEIKRRYNEKELPDMKTIRSDAKKIASKITIGETLFMKEYGVKSEVEYKQKMMEAGKIMKHSVIGWNSWDVTEDGIRAVYNGLKEAGSGIDRLGICCDWIMGVPEQYRDRFQASGSLILNTPEEWSRLGQVVPVHPHLGDHMIGSLNGVENVTNALNAGVTSIGNLAQYFTYEYPSLEMEDYRTEDYIKAMAIMGEFKDQGVCMHCNLDDGYGAQFHDVANLLGWAKLERYVAEDLMGGRLAHCYGNLFSDSFLRIVFNRALSMINKYGTPGTFVNGNTIDYGFCLPRNYAALCAYALPDVACQLMYPSGYAVAPVPFTEAIRIPEPKEIIEAQLTMDMVIEKAPYYARYINWEKVNADAEKLVVGANQFFERVMNALDDLGVDIEHGGEIVSVLKAIGPEQLEIAFGAGRKDEEAMRTRVPVMPTSIVQTINKIQDEALAKQSFEGDGPLSGVAVVVGSTDVHEFGKEVIRNYLRKAGAKVFDLGVSVSIGEIADTLVETGSKVLCMSTYNGMAYSFAKDLMEELKRTGMEDTHVLMGGRLNEAMDGSDVPIDVTDKLTAMGVNADNNLDTIVETIASFQ
ncbi:methylmalonyl-CoA mutase [Anaerotruncus sp. 80]|uniref:Methylmalonyl-CoA mutase n=1 Tax=Anaerotruncus colihominis TaxID=169435 RepID=A0A845QNW1_9FIRM|nr:MULTISPECIES: cobalamin-dependent protein [Anaerotruncus]NBH61718.1 methylmalonyl-CoA mutase [Anaerotruncus colihominis]NCF02373.1 methylmalonyl-CoA mutase [Anaerotruncus sp. 80]